MTLSQCSSTCNIVAVWSPWLLALMFQTTNFQWLIKLLCSCWGCNRDVELLVVRCENSMICWISKFGMRHKHKYMYSAVSHFTSLHSHLCRFNPSGCSWNQSSPLRTSYSRCQRKGGSSSRWTRTWRTLWGIQFVTPKSCQPPPYQACSRSCKAKCWNA